jgi:hypothetical protein
MLSKLHCYNERHKWYEESGTLLKMHRDYAEPISQEKDMEIQSDHFGYVPSCSIKGVCVWSAVPPRSIAEFNMGQLPLAEVVDRTMTFHSHLSDHSKQDAATTHAHMCVLLNKLKLLSVLVGFVLLLSETTLFFQCQAEGGKTNSTVC